MVGALDARTRFVITFEVTYGGFSPGHVEDVVIFHALDSWPQENIPNPIYADLRLGGGDPLTKILETLTNGPDGESAAFALLRRSENDWMQNYSDTGGRRDCRK